MDRLALDGDGVGRLPPGGPDGGLAAFIPYSLPGEDVQADLLERRKNHSRWIPSYLKKSSPQRIDPPCPLHFRPGGPVPCGGCNWQHMSVEAQRDAKRQLVIETLSRLGDVLSPPVAPTVASPQAFRYRNKVQVPFGLRDGRVIAGFFAPNSHRIVEFDDCLIQPESSTAVVQFVKNYANRHGWKPYLEDAHRGWLRHLLVRTNQKGEGLVALVTAQPFFPDERRFVEELRRAFSWIIGVHQNVQSARSNVILGREWRTLWGSERIEEKVLGLRLGFSVGAFFQVNTLSAEKLYAKAIEELGATERDNVVDLFSGVGALALLAARVAGRAYAVESVPPAVKDAMRNAEINNIRNVRFITGEVERVLRGNLIDRNIPSDRLRVIVDPPRSGCDEQVLRWIMSRRPARVVYVSCHPATLARDIKRLSSLYRVGAVTPVDLFPQTAHIETVTRLERK